MNGDIKIKQTVNGFIVQVCKTELHLHVQADKIYTFESMTAMCKHLAKHFKKDVCTCSKGK